jgi:hypothetical protein
MVKCEKMAKKEGDAVGLHAIPHNGRMSKRFDALE